MTNSTIKKEEYVAKIIHDLQSPISAQIAALESFLFTSGEKISQEEKDLILLTLNSCNYMQKLIDIFNSIYKLDFEPIKLNYEKFNVVDLIKNLLEETNILTKYYELNINLQSEEKIILNADKIQIKRVIENLILNSINYAFKNSTVEISANSSANVFNFIIKNKSPYIETQKLKDVFQKQKSLYNKSATDLALYLSREIILAHDGTMLAQSYVDNTNILGFKIPIK